MAKYKVHTDSAGDITEVKFEPVGAAPRISTLYLKRGSEEAGGYKNGDEAEIDPEAHEKKANKVVADREKQTATYHVKTMDLPVADKNSDGVAEGSSVEVKVAVAPKEPAPPPTPSDKARDKAARDLKGHAVAPKGTATGKATPPAKPTAPAEDNKGGAPPPTEPST